MIYDAICIGGGPAGLTAAYTLIKANKTVLVLEKDFKYVGGISRTVQKDGFRFDIGGHRFFSKSAEVVDFWKEVLGPDLLLRRRQSRIFYKNNFYPYPLDILVTLRNLGVFESGLCFFSFIKAKILPNRSPKSFKDWVVNNFGERLFNIFFKTYTEKVWGMSCNEISADWAQQRIKGLSFYSLIKNGLSSLLQISRTNAPKSLIEEFLYPRLGPGMLWERTAELSKEKGCQIQLDSKVVELRLDKEKLVWEVTSQNIAGDSIKFFSRHVISSMPIRELSNICNTFKAETIKHSDKLRYRDFLTVALVVESRDEIPDNWIYIHDPEVMVGRIQNYKAWSPEMVPNSEELCFGLEYFCQENDSLWEMKDEDLISLAKSEIQKIGLAHSSEIKRGYVVRQEKAYPVYDSNYKNIVEQVKIDLREYSPNLHLIGRNGMHKYNNQDHSMMTAILTARNIISGKNEFDVWCVNQDAEYHESGASGERAVPSVL